jgi:cell division septal protein FtsQ
MTRLQRQAADEAPSLRARRRARTRRRRARRWLALLLLIFVVLAAAVLTSDALGARGDLVDLVQRGVLDPANGR